jgi:hypothetical protein
VKRAILPEEAQDRLNDCFLARVGIHHGVIKGTIGPVCMEVSLDESHSFAVDSIYQRFCLRATLTFGDQAAYFICLGSIEKKAKRVVTIPQKVLGSSA